MNTQSNSRTWLFLLELILMILFFALSAAICIQIFAAAHLSAVESNALDCAVYKAQSAAECYKAAGGSLPKTAEQLGENAVLTENCLSISFDADFYPVPQEGMYRLTLTERKAGTASIVISQAEKVIFSIPVKAVGHET